MRIRKVSLALSVSAILLSACGGNADQSATARMVHAPAPNGPPTAGALINPNRRFFGPRKSFSITRTTTGYSVQDLVNGGDPLIVSASATRFTFDDMNVNLAVGEKSLSIPPASLKSLIELYIAFFNRVPDADGMAYWIDQIANGMSLDALASSFYAAAIQFSDLTHYSANMSDADFVRIIYKNVLGRTGDTAPPDADVNYWADQLKTGKSSKGNLVVTMLYSAHTFKNDPNFGWVAQLLDNKVALGSYFSLQQGLSFNTDEDSISQGMLIAAAVTPTDVNAAKAKIAVNDPKLDLTLVSLDPDFIKVQSIINSKCIQCHGPIRVELAPALYNSSLIHQYADRIYLATIVTKLMPLEGSLSAQELADITTWYKNGAK